MEQGTNEVLGFSAKKDLADIFNDDLTLFATRKPARLIKGIIQIATNESEIILDSFAGSGTTAHAVFDAAVESTNRQAF